MKGAADGPHLPVLLVPYCSDVGLRALGDAARAVFALQSNTHFVSECVGGVAACVSL